jgi:membrane-bound metal-dependent hydrolase YbcI (DUF457 family)
MSRRERDTAELIRVYSDPLQHALIAVAVNAPLAARAGRGVLGTAVAAALVIDVDHAVAARSVRVRHTTALAHRPRTHSLLTAALTGAIVTAAAGPFHGWAAFSGLGSHLLHDAGDRAAPTPVLWPWQRPRQLGRRVQLAGTLALTMGSTIVAGFAGSTSRSRDAASADGGSAAGSPRTA